MIKDKILPLRIAVTGITGRMGKEIIRCLVQQQKQQCNSKIVLGAAITKFQSSVCGIDTGLFLNDSFLGITITDNIELVKKDFDVLVDFTTSIATMEYLKFCIINNKNMVIGTTGLSQEHKNLIENASQKIGIVYAANFSIGITIILKLLQDISQKLGNSMDINIIETHHRKKNDIPSGTALMMRNVIKKNRFKSNIVNTIDECNNDICIHSIRAGEIVGEHSVLFTNQVEHLEIKHTAFDRVIFAQGALRAAMWLGISKVGLFDLHDVVF